MSLPPRKRLRPGMGLLSLLLVTGLAALALSQTPQGRDWVEAMGRDLAWIETRSRLRLGLPLRGTPDLDRFEERLAEKGVRLGDPIFMRIFKRESKLELWMKKGDRFTLFATYPICTWSGRLGPKLKQGDRQSPEGFYTVTAGQLNPNSRWHRSFNLGYPNAFDRAHGRTGDFLMVHGGCGSIGCYAMTDPVITEIWKLVTAALKGGQPRFHVHAYPFRMTQANMARFGGGPWGDFWSDLSKGYDLFERSRIPPRVDVCSGRYVARPGVPGSTGHPVRKSCAVRVSGS